jgi:hypothetical protein
LSDPAAVTSPFYEPVCHLPSTTTYFSACLAGCTSSTALTNRTVFHNCACLPANGPDDYVIPGACPSDCNHIYFSILLFLNILFTFVATMPGLVASLRYQYFFEIYFKKYNLKKLGEPVTLSFFSM